jgi:hypothetical protein
VFLKRIEMTSPDEVLSYASFCGALLDDMLEQFIHSVIARSLLDEKVIRKDYGTVNQPIFHDPPFFSPVNSEPKENDNTKIVVTVDDNDNDNGNNSDNEDVNNSDNDSENNNKRKQNISFDNKNTKSAIRYKEPDIGRFKFTMNGKDIYVNALNDNKSLLGIKANAIVVGTAQDTYFKCSNCDRKIAGSRFGAHIDKCLGGRSRK